MADEALTPRSRALLALPALLTAVVVAVQIAYPLVHGTARDHLTVLIVALLAGACVVHAALTRSTRTAAALLIVTALPGYAVEVLGVHTGFPFGSYTYSATLGPRLFGAPPVVALAWTMLAWPAALAARRLVRGPVSRVVVGAWALAAADLFLDPQQVAAGHWTWRFPSPHLLGVPDVPLTNYAGWLALALVLSAGVQAVAGDGDDRAMIGLYLWLYAGWTVSLAVLLDLAAAAAWGAVGMGAVALPLAVQGLRRR
jgi:putative membrane protein